MLKEKATERFKLNTRFSRLDEQRTTDRQTRSAVNQRFLNKVLLQVALDEHAEKRAVALSCIPASHAKNGRPTITRHRDHYTENTPVLFLVQMERTRNVMTRLSQTGDLWRLHCGSFT